MPTTQQQQQQPRQVADPTAHAAPSQWAEAPASNSAVQELMRCAPARQEGARYRDQVGLDMTGCLIDVGLYSPSFRELLNEQLDAGWSFEIGAVGSGAQVDARNQKITIGPVLAGNPDEFPGTAARLLHDSAQVRTHGPIDGLSGPAWAQRELSQSLQYDGQTDAVEMQVRDEILDSTYGSMDIALHGPGEAAQVGWDASRAGLMDHDSLIEYLGALNASRTDSDRPGSPPRYLERLRELEDVHGLASQQLRDVVPPHWLQLPTGSPGE